MSETASEKGRSSTFKKARKAYSAYSWVGRINKLWLWWSGAGAGNATAAVGAAAVVAAGAGMTIAEAVSNRDIEARLQSVIVREAAISAQRAGRARAQRLGTAATLFAVSGRDEAGRAALFDLIVMDKSTVWALGSIDRIERAGVESTGRSLVSQLQAPEIGTRIAAASELIAIGTASREGDAAGEEARAAKRAAQLAGWLGQAAPGKPISALNLGQYRKECEGCDTAATNWQRPIMVVAVRDKEPGVQLGEALADAMRANSNLPHPESYSKFEITGR